MLFWSWLSVWFTAVITGVLTSYATSSVTAGLAVYFGLWTMIQAIQVATKQLS